MLPDSLLVYSKICLSFSYVIRDDLLGLSTSVSELLLKVIVVSILFHDCLGFLDSVVLIILVPGECNASDAKVEIKLYHEIFVFLNFDVQILSMFVKIVTVSDMTIVNFLAEAAFLSLVESAVFVWVPKGASFAVVVVSRLLSLRFGSFLE